MNLFKKPLNYKIQLISGKPINATWKLILLEKVILLEGDENYFFPINNVELISENKKERCGKNWIIFLFKPKCAIWIKLNLFFNYSN